MSSSRSRNGGGHHDLMSQSLTSVLLAPDDGTNSGTILMTTSLNAVVGPDGTLVHTATKPPPPIRTTPVAVPACSQGEGTQPTTLPLSLSQVV